MYYNYSCDSCDSCDNKLAFIASFFMCRGGAIWNLNIKLKKYIWLWLLRINYKNILEIFIKLLCLKC